jgi:GT2 family glycosyltransferase
MGVGGPDKLPEDSSIKARRIGHIMTSPLARGGRFNPSTQHSLMEEKKFVDHIPTCNLCLKKTIFEKVGLFDENFVKGQDLELNYRIIQANYRLLYSPDVIVVHYRKNRIRSFARQVFKWAKAKVAIIRKHGFHGLNSHIYLWPIYGVIFMISGYAILYLLELQILYYLLFLVSSILYCCLIFYESVRLSTKFQDNRLIYYSLLLIPIVHISYGLGIFSALFRKKIW